MLSVNANTLRFLMHLTTHTNSQNCVRTKKETHTLKHSVCWKWSLELMWLAFWILYDELACQNRRLKKKTVSMYRRELWNFTNNFCFCSFDVAVKLKVAKICVIRVCCWEKLSESRIFKSEKDWVEVRPLQFSIETFLAFEAVSMSYFG